MVHDALGRLTLARKVLTINRLRHEVFLTALAHLKALLSAVISVCLVDEVLAMPPGVIEAVCFPKLSRGLHHCNLTSRIQSGPYQGLPLELSLCRIELFFLSADSEPLFCVSGERRFLLIHQALMCAHSHPAVVACYFSECVFLVEMTYLISILIIIHRVYVSVGRSLLVDVSLLGVVM